MTAQAPVERVNSKVRRDVVYVLRRGPSLADALYESGAQYVRDVEVGFLRLAPELRFSIEHRQSSILADIQVALRAYYGLAAIAFLRACVVHVVGLKAYPVNGEEFATSAPDELIAEVNAVMIERIKAMQAPAVAGAVQ